MEIYTQYLDQIIRPTMDVFEEVTRIPSTSGAVLALLLGTGGKESADYRYICQIRGPALSHFQIEPFTFYDVIQRGSQRIGFSRMLKLLDFCGVPYGHHEDPATLIYNLRYACLIARLKYYLDRRPVPRNLDPRQIYEYYKTVYNTHLGASTWENSKKYFEAACDVVRMRAEEGEAEKWA